MEGLTLSRLAPSVLADLDAKQFATPGKSTEQAIAYILHLVLENLDRGNCSARLFFADFRKAFDLIDHNILLHKLLTYGFDVHNALLRWVAAFLECIDFGPQMRRLNSDTISICGGIWGNF